MSIFLGMKTKKTQNALGIGEEVLPHQTGSYEI